MHGNAYGLSSLCIEAKRMGADRIFQVGDFGFWPREKWGQKYLRKVQKFLRMHDMNLYWIDGNHEDFDSIEKWQEKRPKTEEGFYQFDRNIFYVPRGTKWEWEGKTFMGFGGAYSIDKNRRLAQERIGGGKSWFEQEMITDKQVCAVLDVPGTVDVLFTHDAPRGTKWDRPFSDYKTESFSRANRTAVSAIMDHVKPGLLIHGHYHERYTAKAFCENGKTVRVEGLDMEYHAGATLPMVWGADIKV